MVDAGLRIDHVGFQVEDFLIQCSRGRDFGQLTGQGGILFRPTSEVEVFANLSQSFQTPTTTELVASAEA